MSFDVRVELREPFGGAPRGELTGARVGKLERLLAGPGALELDVDPFDPLAPRRSDLGAVEVYVYVDGSPWWGGPLWNVKGSDSGLLTYSGRELESYLADRPIEADLSFAGVDQATILWDLLAHTQGQADGDLGIVSAIAATGVTRTRDYYVDERPTVDSLMGAFRDLVNGVEWAIVVRADGSRALTTYHPARGQHRADRRLEHGTNVTAFEWTVDGHTVNDVITRGPGEGPARPEGRYTDTANRAARGRRTAVIDGGNTTETASLVERSQAEVELRADPLELVSSLTVRNTPEVPVLELEVGDTHPVRIERGAIDVAGTMRIVSIDLDPYAETAKLGVQA